jgi:predicted translin family RNA/ssDNA-binding protein
MTGEAMRLAVNCVTKGDLETPKRVLTLLQQLYASFNTLPNTREIKDMDNKLEVMKQSLQKVENLCLKVVVRRAEFPGQDILSGMDDDPDVMAE